MRRARLQLEGQQFGRLTVAGKTEGKPSYWDCTCECGRVVAVRGTRLVQGITASCKCLRTTHGHTSGGKRSGTYLSWTAMKQRCNNSKESAYGGRGIQYDPRWESFESFLEDVGERPEGRTLDRINPMLHYSKLNVRWADALVQANNKRDSTVLYFNFDHNGAEGTAAEWARWLQKLTGNDIWTVKYLHACLKGQTLDQLVCSVHPAGLTPQGLAERIEQIKIKNRTAEQKETHAYLDRLLEASPIR